MIGFPGTDWEAAAGGGGQGENLEKCNKERHTDIELHPPHHARALGDVDPPRIVRVGRHGEDLAWKANWVSGSVAGFGGSASRGLDRGAVAGISLAFPSLAWSCRGEELRGEGGRTLFGRNARHGGIGS